MSHNQLFDGERGSGCIGGWWIDRDEAKRRGMNEEWWKSTLPDGRKVDDRQHDNNGPRDKPIWLFVNGDMYLGSWEKIGLKILEAGFGISYDHTPREVKGKCYIGDFKIGTCHGYGRSFWLEASPSWKSNRLPRSEIKEKGRGKRKGLPYEYVGGYKQDVKDDKNATVTLKDGTKKYGVWKKGKPIVPTNSDWWTDHNDEKEIVVDLTMNQVISSATVAVSLSLSRNNNFNEVASLLEREAIGHDANKGEMEEYAKNLVGIGCHSVEFIKIYCEDKDVDGWDWMKQMHRRAFKKWLSERNK